MFNRPPAHEISDTPTMGADPFSGTVYVFRAKRADCAS